MALDLTKWLELQALCDKTDGGSRPAVSDGTAVDSVSGATFPAGANIIEYYDADGNVYATCKKPVDDMIKTEGEIIPAGTIINGEAIAADYIVQAGEEWIFDGDEACEKNPQTVFKAGDTLPPRMIGKVDVTLDDGTVVTLGAGDPIPANATESDIVVGPQGNATCVSKADWSCHKIPSTAFQDVTASTADLVAEAEAYADANPNLGPMFNDPVTGLTIVRDDAGGYCCTNEPNLDITCTYQNDTLDSFVSNAQMLEDYDAATGMGTLLTKGGSTIRYRISDGVDDTRYQAGAQGHSPNNQSLIGNPESTTCYEYWTEPGDVELCEVLGCKEKYGLKISVVSINEPHTLIIDQQFGSGPNHGIDALVNAAVPQDPAVGLAWNVSGNTYELVGSTTVTAAAPAPSIIITSDLCKDTYYIKILVTEAGDERPGVDWWSIFPQLIKYKPTATVTSKVGEVVARRTCNADGDVINAFADGVYSLSDWTS